MNKKMRVGIKDNLPEGVKFLKIIILYVLGTWILDGLKYLGFFIIESGTLNLLAMFTSFCVAGFFYWMYTCLLKGKNWVRIFWRIIGGIGVINFLWIILTGSYIVGIVVGIGVYLLLSFTSDYEVLRYFKKK